jgi:hypothetical protein
MTFPFQQGKVNEDESEYRQNGNSVLHLGFLKADFKKILLAIDMRYF